MSEPILRISDLMVRKGSKTILNDVSIEVAPRSIVALVGAKGAGKTTLMHAICGVSRTDGGRVRFDGRDITHWPAHAIVAAGLSHAPEGRHIFSTLTVLENLRLGAGKRSRTGFAGDLDRMLAMFPLLRVRLGHSAGSMSEGEQQMLCIARALINRPQVLLLDEPSAGLAPIIVRQIFSLVREIRDSGTAVLLSEQNAKAALRVADQAYVMEDGRVAVAGPAGTVSAHPRVQAAFLNGSVA
jgi:branched-chain amino acid transport system ATP-binding protein